MSERDEAVRVWGIQNKRIEDLENQLADRICFHISGGYVGALCSKCAPILKRQLAEAQGKLESIKIRLLEIVEEEGEVGVDPSYLFSMLDTIDPTILGPITPVILGESE